MYFLYRQYLGSIINHCSEINSRWKEKEIELVQYYRPGYLYYAVIPLSPRRPPFPPRDYTHLGDNNFTMLCLVQFLTNPMNKLFFFTKFVKGWLRVVDVILTNLSVPLISFSLVFCTFPYIVMTTPSFFRFPRLPITMSLAPGLERDSRLTCPGTRLERWTFWILKIKTFPAQQVLYVFQEKITENKKPRFEKHTRISRICLKYLPIRRAFQLRIAGQKGQNAWQSNRWCHFTCKYDGTLTLILLSQTIVDMYWEFVDALKIGTFH